ncbi:MAG: hypothetical protein ACYTFQ_15465, partial [Planctomycetota bacterium]
LSFAVNDRIQLPLTSIEQASYMDSSNCGKKYQQKSFGWRRFSAFKNRPDDSVNWMRGSLHVVCWTERRLCK